MPDERKESEASHQRSLYSLALSPEVQSYPIRPSALTVPTSMESFFNGENPEGKQPAIVQPEGELKSTELAFYRGFDEGYKAMIASIRESINQVMQQMQIPNNMELPEGMMPPQPDAGQP